MTTPSLREIAELETERATRNGRWFSVLRLAPGPSPVIESDTEMLEIVVRANLRRTDAVRRVRHEVGVILVEAGHDDASVPLARLRDAIEDHMAGTWVRIGWAAVGPGQRATWEEAWHFAGQLLVADAVVPAAA